MIVYNVDRHWFADKLEAETYRKYLGLKPAAMLKLTIADRHDLAALLDVLCSPPLPGKLVKTPATPALVDRAAVSPAITVPDYIPSFLLREDVERQRVARAVARQKGLSPEADAEIEP